MQYTTKKYRLTPGNATKDIDAMINNGWSIFYQSYIDVHMYITFVKPLDN